MYKILNQAAQKAKEVLLSNYGKNISISTKRNPRDFVTNVDIEAQKIIQEELLSLMIKKGVAKEEVGFIGEESLYEDAPHLFIIDPIDGTSSYIQGDGKGAFGISIAYAYKHQLLSGIVNDPLKNVSYFAQKGEGAKKITDNGELKLKVKKSLLHQVTVTKNRSSDLETRKIDNDFMLQFDKLVKETKISRSSVISTISVCEHPHALHVGNAYIWDIAATMLILKEAGGDMTDWHGKPISFRWQVPEYKYQFLAGHPDTIGLLIEALG